MNKKFYFLIFVAIVFLYYLIYLLGHTKVVVNFEDLQPFNHILPVYFKGFKLGHTAKVYLAPDFNSTIVELKLRLKDIRLPENTTAVIRRHDDRDYIELVYPTSPHLAYIRNNTVIKGEKGINFEHYLQDQANNGGLDEIKLNINNTIKSAGDTFEALTGMITVITEILEDAKPTINAAVNNFNQTTKNLSESSESINRSIQKGYIDKTLYNLELSSGNLNATTQNFSSLSLNANKQSINLFNCFLKNINTVTCNINQIVIGLGNTMKKRFGGLRLIFGKTMS